MASAVLQLRPDPIALERRGTGGNGQPLVDALRAAGEPTRLRILAILHDGERTVSELAWVLGQSQPRVSRHLRILGDAGLIERVAEGSWLFCRRSDHPVARAVLSCLTDDEPGVRGDRERLAELRHRRTQDALEYFQRHAHDWDRLRSLYVSESRVEAAVLDAIGDAPCDTLLDIGTGTGRMLQLLAPRAETAIGIDSSAAMLAAARPTFEQPTLRHVQLRHGDMYRLPIADASIDRVIIHQVLHFADDPERVAREIARVLRPGGRALVVDFAPHALEFLRTDHAHRRLGFSTDEVAGWGTRAGLTVREVTRLSGAPLTVVLWEAAKGHTDHPA